LCGDSRRLFGQGVINCAVTSYGSFIICCVGR
jgi:hypothetical protein